MNTAVIFAGGTGSRMNNKTCPKQFIKINSKPIIAYTLEHFQKAELVDNIVIACIEPWIDHLREIVREYGFTKVKKIVPGGETGQASIYNGLVAAKEVSGSAKTPAVTEASSGDETDTFSGDIVLIHDGVRPLINSELINANIRLVAEKGSSVTVARVQETVVSVDEDEYAAKDVADRENSRLARAPQCFYLDDILAAHKQAIKEGKLNFIDSCTMMRYYGRKIYLIDGPAANIKITTPEDVYMMRAYLEAQENLQLYGLE